MENTEKWLFPGTAVATLLKFRPMSFSLLEKFGMDPWDTNHPSIGAQCGFRKIPFDTFLAEMKSLPLPEEGADWKSLPIYYLVDFLTREHWHFLNRLLPAINHALSQDYAADGDSLRRLRCLIEEWPMFSKALEDHIQEEDAFLFPKILHYEYSLRQRRYHPDFSGGSVNVYIALRMLENEKQKMAGVRRFLAEVPCSKAALMSPDCLENRVAPLLQELQTRLARHAALESEVLFPMAKAIDKALLDARISGKAVTRGHSPTLMPTL